MKERLKIGKEREGDRWNRFAEEREDTSKMAEVIAYFVM